MIVSLLSFDISKGLIIRCVTQKVKYVTVGFFLNYATFETDDIFRKGKPGQHIFINLCQELLGFFQLLCIVRYIFSFVSSRLRFL